MADADRCFFKGCQRDTVRVVKMKLGDGSSFEARVCEDPAHADYAEQEIVRKADDLFGVRKEPQISGLSEKTAGERVMYSEDPYIERLTKSVLASLKMAAEKAEEAEEAEKAGDLKSASWLRFESALCRGQAHHTNRIILDYDDDE